MEVMLQFAYENNAVPVTNYSVQGMINIHLLNHDDCLSIKSADWSVRYFRNDFQVYVTLMLPDENITEFI